MYKMYKFIWVLAGLREFEMLACSYTAIMDQPTEISTWDYGSIAQTMGESDGQENRKGNGYKKDRNLEFMV